MKIIHFIPSLDRASGGTASYMQLLSNELGKLGELYIITAPSINPLKISHSKIIFIPCSWKERKSMKKEWIKLLHNIHPDIVHINCCWLPQCAWAQSWAQDLGYNVVLTPHGMLEPWIMKRHFFTRKLPALLLYQKKAIKKANYLHATAESEKLNLINLGLNNNIEVIANGININTISLKATWKKNKKILFLSRIHVKKGIEFLLNAIAALKEELKEYTIYIAGEGDTDYIKQLKEKARALGISNLILFCGGVYGEKKWELFQKADVFILPTYSENFGIVIAESLASGTPVITTKGTPWKDLELEHCGWWTEIGTVPTINAIKLFLSCSDEELENMGKKGRLLVEKKYSSKQMAEKMLTLYHKIIDSKKD